jgi:hypothetical protein
LSTVAGSGSRMLAASFRPRSSKARLKPSCNEALVEARLHRNVPRIVVD